MQLRTGARLRVPPTPFLGRARELALLDELLDDRQRRLVTVVGAPGAGKTRLAVEAARRSETRFPDGVVEVSLAALADPALVTATLLAAAGGLDAGSNDTFSQLVNVLGEGRRLLVVDNTEHLPATGPVLAQLLELCSELTILATGRQPLAVSPERVMPLGPLDAPDPAGLDPDEVARLDAVRLLEDRLRAAGAEVDGSPTGLHILAEICRLVDGLPLAIELAAARGRVQSIPGIRAALEQRLPHLDRGPRDAEPRHRTMRDAVAWSVELLDPPVAVGFRYAGLFAGRWTVAALAAVAPGMGTDDAADAVEALVDRSLVVAEPRGPEVRYRMLAVIREVAGELLVAGERREGERRHALYLLRVAQRAAAGVAGTAMGGALDTLEEERDDLRAALTWAVRTRDTAVAEGLCLAQRMLWYVRGPLHEGCAAFGAALSLPVEDAGRRSRVLSEAVALERQRGALSRAASLAVEATALARTTGDVELLCGALLQEGFVAHLRGDFPAARTLLDESARLAEGRDDVALARALHHLGIVLHFGEGDDARALELQRRALGIYRAHGVRRQVATVQVGIAELERCAGRLAAAQEAMVQAMRLFAELGDLPVLSYALQEAAALAATAGRLDRALRLLGAADHLEAMTGAPTWPVLTRVAEEWLPQALAAVGLHRAGDLRRSGALLEPGEAIAFACGDDDESAAEHRLSRRERQIASLVAAGLTNREIGQRLFLSERTVDGHVARILRKLEFRSRTQIATWVGLGTGRT